MVFKPEWEKAAMNGEEFPEDCNSYPNQILYLQLRTLYDQLRKGIIDRATAIKDKKRLMSEYGSYSYRSQMEDEWVAIIKATELARAEYRKNPCHENAMKLIQIIEGGKVSEAIPQPLR